MNFTAYSYAPGFINLTWLSGFNGGPEQHFLLFRKEGSDWEKVANLTDPGEGRMGHFDPGLLSEGQKYWFRLNSCNRVNCSVQSTDVQITVSVRGKITHVMIHYLTCTPFPSFSPSFLSTHRHLIVFLIYSSTFVFRSNFIEKTINYEKKNLLFC